MNGPRMNRSVTLGELLRRDGGAMLGSKEPCPRCGKEPRPFEVRTPRHEWLLMFFIPCCCGSRSR